MSVLEFVVQTGGLQTCLIGLPCNEKCRALTHIERAPYEYTDIECLLYKYTEI